MKQIHEGGHAVSGDRILKANIEPTLKKFIPILKQLIPDAEFKPIGSTGKKPDNGDIDLAVSTSKGLDAVNQAFVAEGYKTAPSKGFNQVSVYFPQYDAAGIENELGVQVDLMLGDIRWLSFMYMGYGPDETAYKPLARTACIYGLLRFACEMPQEDGSVRFYSISPNKGIFLKQGSMVNDKFVSTKVSEEVISEPDQVAELISEASTELWSVRDLSQPVEYIVAKVSRSFPKETARKIKDYVIDFLEKQKLEGPVSLKENTKKTSHLTHIEDLILDEGMEGGEKAIKYIDALSGKLDTPMKATLKVDGSFAIHIGNNYPGIPGVFVGMKNTFSPKAPQIFQSPAQIQERYGDKPDLASKLAEVLQYASDIGIPDGQVWKGDFLFSKKDLELYADPEGVKWVTFTPNTLTYAFKLDSDEGRRVLRSQIGIAFHTRYSGDDLRTAESTANFDVSVSDLASDEKVFLMDANLNSESPDLSSLQALRKELSKLLMQAEPVADEIAASSSLNAILNQFSNAQVRKGEAYEGDFASYMRSFESWVVAYFEKESKTKKTEKGIQQTVEKGQQVIAYFQNQKFAFKSLLDFQALLVKAKQTILRAFESRSSMRPMVAGESGLSPAAHEGFAVSDVDGNIVKLVDRQNFSRMNLSKHVESTIRESRNISAVRFHFPAGLKGYSDIHSSAQYAGVLTSFGRGIVNPQTMQVTLGPVGTSHVALSKGVQDAKRFYYGYAGDVVYVVTKNGMDDKFIRSSKVLQQILTQVFNLLRLSVTGKLRFEEKLSPDEEEEIDSKLATHDLSRRKPFAKKTGTTNTYSTEVEAPEGVPRKKAAQNFASAEDVKSVDIPAGDQRPVIIAEIAGVELVLNFKDNRKSPSKLDARQTKIMEETWAQFMQMRNVGKDYPSYEQVAEGFEKVTPEWYESFVQGSNAIASFLGNEEYVFSREDKTFPTQPTSIHTLINKTFTARKDAFGKIGSKKDAWNPSDVYACKLKDYADIVDQWQTLSKDSVSGLQDFNGFLQTAMKSKSLVGISLKKLTNPKEPELEAANTESTSESPSYNYSLASFAISTKLPSLGGRFGAMLKFTGPGEPPLLGDLRFFGSSATQSRTAGALQLELKATGSKARMGKVPTGIVAAWAAQLSIDIPSKKQALQQIKEPEQLMPMVVESYESGTLNISPAAFKELMTSALASQDQEDLIFASQLPSLVAFAALFARATPEFINDIVNGAKKVGTSNAPFIKVS